MSKSTIFSTNIENVLSLHNEDTDLEEVRKSIASVIGDNPAVKWAKLIVTDDIPNENKQRVPQSEFANLIRTGAYMPIKMAYSEIKDGHEDSYPLGVLAHLKQSGNQIVALAALWLRERGEDIEYIKQCIAEKIPVNISWEILHEDSSIDDGVESLIGTSLSAVTIVGKPAYAGRTPILDIASKNDDGTGESNSEDKKVEQIEILQQKVSELEAALSAKTEELTALADEIRTKDEQIVALTEFKTGIEAKEQEAAKLASIKETFKAAKIEKSDEYFEENKASLLAMDESSLSFMVQELVAFSTKKETNSSKIPNLDGQNVENEIDIKEIAKELRTKK